MSAYTAAAALLADTVTDTVKSRPPDDQVSPGLLGFLVTFALVLVTIVLIRSMVGHLRKVRYSPDPANPEGPEPQKPVDEE